MDKFNAFPKFNEGLKSQDQGIDNAMSTLKADHGVEIHASLALVNLQHQPGTFAEETPQATGFRKTFKVFKAANPRADGMVYEKANLASL